MIFENNSKTYTSLEPLQYEFGHMSLKVPALDNSSIISRINDANSIIYFGCQAEPISLTMAKGSANNSPEAAAISVDFFEGYFQTSILKNERDAGICYLTLKDSQRKEWKFKIDQENLLGCQAELSIDFTGGR